MAKYSCWGCGSDVQETDVYPQGTGAHRLTFCQACNKVYPKFQTMFADKARKLDEQRANIREECRKEVFGKKAPPKEHVLTDVAGKPVAHGASAAVGMRAELSAGGDGAVTEGELDPELEKIATTKGRVKKNV